MVLFSDLRDFSAVKLQQLLLRVLVLGEEKGREREAGWESGRRRRFVTAQKKQARLAFSSLDSKLLIDERSGGEEDIREEENQKGFSYGLV